MIYIHFIYKDSVVDIEKLDEDIDSTTETEIIKRIEDYKIRRPENFERVIIRKYKINELFVGKIH